MTSENLGRRRTPRTAAWPAAALVAALCTAAEPAAAVDAAPRARHELVPTGARATIQLDAPSSAEDTVRELRMEKGKSVFVRTGYTVTRVSVGDPRVADVIVLQTQELQIVAKEMGATNVVLWGGSGEIEAAIDLHVGSAYSGIESEIRRVVEVGDVHVESAGNAIVLTGSVPDAASVERVVAVAHAYFPEKEESQIVNLLSVGGNQQVMIEVTVSEIDRKLRRAIGTNFAAINGNDWAFFNLIDGLTSPSSTDSGIGHIIQFSQSINLIGSAFDLGGATYLFFVNALDETGIGKVLAEPTLIARTGETAKFLSGGEVPIPIAQSLDRITIEYKEFGVAVSFTPTVLSDDRIHMDVSTEVSQVDFSLGTAVLGTTAPGFRTRRSSTGVELGDGQTFAIAGLLRDEVAEKVAGYPLLGKIPIIGMLFRSSAWEKQTTELVMLVRPRLVKPLGVERPPLPTDYFDEPNWFEFYLLGRAEGFDELASAEAPQAGFVGDAGYRLPASPEETDEAGQEDAR